MKQILRNRNSIATLLIVIITALAGGCKKHTDSDNQNINSPKINSFVFTSADNSNLTTDITGAISGDSIIINMEWGIDISSLKPSISYNGTEINPANHLAQDFTIPLTYVVKNATGTTKTYIVKVNRLSSNRAIYSGSGDGKLYALNAANGSLRWTYQTGGAIVTSITVFNNTVYFGSSDKYFYAIDAASGMLKWRYLTAYPINYSCATVSNGTVFFSCSSFSVTGNIYALNAETGALKWLNNSVFGPGIPLVSNGKLYIGDFGNNFWALDESTGATIWTFPAGISIGNPAISNNRLFFAGEYYVYCVNPQTGAEIWRYPAITVKSGPAVNNNRVYIIESSKIKALSATNGSLIWQYSNTSSAVFSSPVIENGFLYAGTTDDAVIGINELTGEYIWKAGFLTFTPPVAYKVNPTVAHGMVFGGGTGNYLYAYNGRTGDVIWKYETGGKVYGGPCIVDAAGNIFHPGESGEVN